MKILIAEDDTGSRKVLAATLTKLGHEVIAATDGREALAAFQTHPVHLVISDWMMPNFDGLELCRRIRGEQRALYTYFILLTALGGKSDYLEGMEAGADDFITKPFDRDQLVARLRVAERILGLQAEVKQLEGLLPICSYCKKIQSEESGTWVEIESYINAHTDAAFSHGICPECFESEVKPELARWRREHPR